MIIKWSPTKFKEVFHRMLWRDVCREDGEYTRILLLCKEMGTVKARLT